MSLASLLGFKFYFYTFSEHLVGMVLTLKIKIK